MSKLFFDGAPVPIDPKESVLDALLRAGHDIPYGCKSGACQACMLTAEKGDIPAQSQPGLTDSQKQMGCFLSCSCYPNEDTSLYVQASEDAVERIAASVTEKSFIGDSIIRLRLSAALSYQAGQYVTLWKDDKLARSYSIASVSSDQSLEFHIKHIENGAFSAWVAKELKQGDTLHLQGPMGSCFYTSSSSEQNLVLAGIGTGLAPLYGIVRDALAQQHQGQIFLYVAAKYSKNFYYVEELKKLEAENPKLSVIFVAQELSDDSHSSFASAGDIYATVKQQHPDMKNHRVFLCGAESFVKKLKKQSFLAGANMKEILSDSFLTSGH